MSQLQIDGAEEELWFVARAADGRVLDVIPVHESRAARQTGKVENGWHEAACWAFLAIESDRRRQAEKVLISRPNRRGAKCDT